MAEASLQDIARLRELLRRAKQLNFEDDIAHWKAELKKLGVEE